MEKEFRGSSRPFIAMGAILAWCALILQFYLILEKSTTSSWSTIIRFFSYFTILCNILVALCFSFLLSKPGSSMGRFFCNPKVITSIAVHITIVGLVYNFILRKLWAPTGMQKLADELLHLVDPALFILFWIIFVPKRTLQWIDIFPWLLFPLIYIIYIFIRGPFAGEYPYPFLDVNKFGYVKVLLNSGIILILYVVIALLFVAMAKGIKTRTAGIS